MEKDYKGKTNELLMKVYKEKGISHLVTLAYKILERNTHKSNKIFRAHVHGEVCETVLECAILDFMKNHKEETKDWILSKGLILPNIEKVDSRFRTEVDVTLFTPYKILTFECKSYEGDKTITDECTVRRPGIKPANVFKQHSLHVTMMMKIFIPCRYNRPESKMYAPAQLAYFNFALGDLKDERDEQAKKRMPIITVDNINRLLAVYLNKPILWDMNDVRRFVEKLESYKEEQTKKHLEYVKSIHG